MDNPTDWKPLYPFKSRYFDLGGLRYHYVDEGSGPPVVMVHGNPTWSFYYRELIKALRPTHRCIAPDHIGCGLSDKPGDSKYSYTLDRRVSDLDALLSHLSIERDVTLVVHDWGGMIGLSWALLKPERISRLIILNTSGFLLPIGKRLPQRLKMLRDWKGFGNIAVLRMNAFARGALTMASRRGLAPAVRAGLVAPYDTPSNRIATLRFVQDIPLVPGDAAYETAKRTDDNLHTLAKLPAMICWGRHDFVFDSHFLAEWRRRFPNAETHAFDDAGHYVLEDAGKRVIPLVKDFIRRHPGPAAEPVAAKSEESRAILNVAAHLRAAAKANPDQRAIVWTRNELADGRAEYAYVTFRELDVETDRYAHGMAAAGIARGMLVIVMVRPSLEFFVLTFALYKIGAVPVLIDPGMGKRRMVECLRSVDAQAFAGIPLAHLLRMTHREAFKTCHIKVTVGRRWGWGGLTLDKLRPNKTEPFPIAATEPDDPAAIIFTTGSTGAPKGVLFQHRTFDAQVRILRDYFKIQPGEIDLPTFPLFALFDPALGMTAVLPDMDPTRPAWVDPTKIARAIHDQNVTHMFGSPALLDRVGRHGEAHSLRLPSIRRVISAGAPVPPATLERFAGMLDVDARIHTPYGATEALPVSAIDHREILGETAQRTALGEGTCVGRPMPDVEVRIIRIDDGPIETIDEATAMAAGEIGEIIVKGPVVTRRYCTDEQANRLAKIVDGSAIWHRMGDVGRMDADGRLWFCGRKAHRVVTPSGTLFTDPCEAIFNAHPRVFRSALVGVGERPDQRPVMCIELNAKDARENLDALTHELLVMGRAHGHTRTIETVLYHGQFPVDIRHNAKIFRERLSEWATEQLR